MKYLVASDIHGSYLSTVKVIDQFNKLKCDKLILLGDILYHGPRNDLPDGFDPKKTVVLLNEYADKIICVQGNCDSEVDQMVLNFPILAPYFIMEIKGKLAYFTHGHIFNSANLPAKDIFLIHGHTHEQKCELLEDHIYINPGSVSLPKNNSYKGFIVIENGLFTFYDLDGKVMKTFAYSGKNKQ